MADALTPTGFIDVVATFGELLAAAPDAPRGVQWCLIGTALSLALAAAG